jgi:hypothetical protein
MDGAYTLMNGSHIRNWTADSLATKNKLAASFRVMPHDISCNDGIDILNNDIEAFKIKFNSVYCQSWQDYFPWKNITDVVDTQMPWRIWEMQGQHSTWFVGSYTSYESVADIIDYNLQLVNARVCGGPTLSPKETPPPVVATRPSIDTPRTPAATPPVIAETTTVGATTVEQNVVKADASGMSATASNSGNGDDDDDKQVGLLSALLAAILLLIVVVIGAMFRVQSAMAGAARTTDSYTKPPSSSPASREDSDVIEFPCCPKTNQKIQESTYAPALIRDAVV